jgi:hypothetical protein
MRDLTLYRVQAEPPQLIVADAEPQFGVSQSLGPLTLVGYDLASNTVQPGGRLVLKFYWRANDLPRDQIVTSLGKLTLEQHELGLGNWQRYVTEVRPAHSDLIVESYAVVVPATVTPGQYPLTVGLQSWWPQNYADGAVEAQTETLTLAEIIILAGKVSP